MFSIRQTFSCCLAVALATHLMAGSILVVIAAQDDDDKEARARAQTSGNLCVITSAMFAYHDKYGHLPPAHILGTDGKPAHSWRVLLLPFIDQEDLYKQYKFNEPWNGPNNRKLAGQMPAQYCTPVARPAGKKNNTSFVVLVGAKTAFPGRRAVTLKDITDGRDKTILVAEAEGFGIHWMEPRDWDVDAFPIQISDVTKPGFSSYRKLFGPFVALADDKRFCLSFSAPVDHLIGMSTIAGGEKVDLKLVEGK